MKARTSDGLILDHDGHTHFIFYSDLKNILDSEKRSSSVNRRCA
ncbi:hypothetical protein [Streptococcus anginosus]